MILKWYWFKARLFGLMVLSRAAKFTRYKPLVNWCVSQSIRMLGEAVKFLPSTHSKLEPITPSGPDISHTLQILRGFPLSGSIAA